MAITYPYSLADLADLLRVSSVTWDVQRNDEVSGLGDGRVWQAELAPPLWKAEVTLIDLGHNQAKQIAALIRKLHGAQESFWLYDPLSKFPQYDPDGTLMGSATPTVRVIASDRVRMGLKGLPNRYKLAAGDKIQIAYGTNPVRNAFLEVCEATTASATDGTTVAFHVFPAIPTGVVADLPVILVRPACKVFILPGSHNPGRAQGMVTSGAGFTAIEKK